jgi:hypothetical protein
MKRESGGGGRYGILCDGHFDDVLRGAVLGLRLLQKYDRHRRFSGFLRGVMEMACALNSMILDTDPESMKYPKKSRQWELH